MSPSSGILASRSTVLSLTSPPITVDSPSRRWTDVVATRVETIGVGTGSVAGTISLVYDHRKKGLQARLADIQHRYFLMVVTSLHVHLEQHNYLEVLLVQGPAKDLHTLADELITCRGVKHGRLNLTATTIPPLVH